MSSRPAFAVQPSELEQLNRQFEDASPEDILRWAVATFPNDIILTCSFQHEGVALAHMLRTIKPDIPVVFINTGFAAVLRATALEVDPAARQEAIATTAQMMAAWIEAEARA